MLDPTLRTGILIALGVAIAVCVRWIADPTLSHLAAGAAGGLMLLPVTIGKKAEA